MTPYYCNYCFYETKKRSDFNKHLKTRKHNSCLMTLKNKKKISLRKSSDTVTELCSGDVASEEKPLFLCSFCETNYSRLDNLKRHEVKCSKRIIYEKDKELQKQNNKLLKCEQELHYFKQIIQLSEKKEDTSISKFKFINKNYNTAGPLKKITYDDFAQINQIKFIDNDKKNFISDRKTYNEKLIEDVLYSYRHDILDSYIGEAIVKMYKNFDPSNQSIWITDQSRLKYVIRTCDDRDNTYWTADKNGKNTNRYLVSPIIKEIKKLLIEYQSKYCTPCDGIEYSFDYQEKMMKDSEDICQIVRDIDDEKLNKKILKFISSEFSVDMNTKKT